MNSILKIAKEHAKSIAAWVGGVLVTMLLNLVNGVSPWPQTGAQWTQYALTSFGAAFAVWVAPANKITQKQLDKDPNVIGGTVVPDAPHADHITVNPATGQTGQIPRSQPGEYQNPWREQ